MKYTKALVVLLVVIFPTLVFAAETNTVSSTVVTDKAPPTANAPSIVVNNSDVCKSAYSVAAQTGFVGISSGMTVTDENCERIKLSRGLFGMGMKVAAVSMLCQDVRIFDAMIMAGTPCPYKGKIGAEALQAWKDNPGKVPEGSNILHEESSESVTNINNYEFAPDDGIEIPWQDEGS
jgi:hypothetical protein|tara:strand:+ start:115 stop:648 length:534 start_codon:yes stop_codon:yes gene_type:complete